MWYVYQLTVRDSLNLAMDEEITRDENVFLLGEAASVCLRLPAAIALTAVVCVLCLGN